MALVTALGQKFPIEQLDHPVIGDLSVDRVVVFGQAPLGIALAVVLPRAIEIPAVLGGLGQGKQEVNLGLRVEIASGDPGLHLLNVFITQAIRLEVGETPVGRAAVGAQTDALPVGLDRLFLPADGLEHVSQTEMGAHVIGAQFQGALKGLDGLIGQRRRRKSAAQQEVGLNIVGLHLDGAPETADRFFETVLLLERPAAVDDGADKIRSVGYGSPQIPLRLVEPGLGQGYGSHHAQGVDVGRVCSQDLTIQGLRLLHATGFLVLCC